MFKLPEKYRVKDGVLGSEAGHPGGVFNIKNESGKLMTVIASDGFGWEHVSVSLKNRTPSWREMCKIKDIFWDENDTVVQYHPAKKNYVNNHKYCLHLWKPRDVVMPIPPSLLVGIKSNHK